MIDRAGPHHPAPKETLDRCSVRAELRGDPQLGTAFPANRLLLVEQPGPWGRGGLIESDFDPRLAHRLVDGFGALGVRVLAIRRPGRSHLDRLRRFALADCRQGSESLMWGEYRRDADLIELALAAFGQQVRISETRPCYLVCAHGSHDACCAVRGRPVAAALLEVAGENTWECSHVGGDRFAANVLALPAGMLYGSVHPDRVADLVAATAGGGVLAELLRGKVGLGPEAQAALAFVLDRLGGGWRDWQVTGATNQSSVLALVELADRAGGRHVTVRVRIGQSAVHRLTCHMTAPSTVLTYHPEGLTEQS